MAQKGHAIVNVPDDVYKKAKVIAALENKTIKAVLVDAMQMYVDKNGEVFNEVHTWINKIIKK